MKGDGKYMKIGILSDCHLGQRKFRKMANGNQNMWSFMNYNAFNEAIDILADQNADLVIIAGDLFDHPNPDVHSLQVANKALGKLVKGKGIPLRILGGNHDYSELNSSLNCHPFDLLENFDDRSFDRVKTVHSNISMEHLGADQRITLTMVPYGLLNSENFAKMYRWLEAENAKHGGKNFNILAIHGYVNLQGQTVDMDDGSQTSLYGLPKEVAQNYNLIICGHVHLPGTLYAGETTILTPGSLMPSNMAINSFDDMGDVNGKNQSCVYTFDTSDKTLKTFAIKSAPKVHFAVTSDINSTLKVISESDIKSSNNYGIYNIKYNGVMEDVDEYLYKKAFANSLNINIQTEFNTMNVPDDIMELFGKNSDFWNFVDKNYHDRYDEFKALLNEL